MEQLHAVGAVNSMQKLCGASGKRWSTEIEVQKPKYGSEKNSRLSVFSALLTHECVLRPCRQKGAQSLQCESRIFSSRTAANITITNCAMCMWQPDPNQASAWANHVDSMLLECLDSYADASVVVVLLQWLNHLQNYSRDTRKYSP